jgi:Concanavalin A-like lectin/glucanases superfamily
MSASALNIGPGSVLKPGISVATPLLPLSYTLTPGTDSVDEGAGALFVVSTTAVADGTTLYWTVENTTTSDADFSEIHGSVNMMKGIASFTVSPVADNLTEGAETFYVALRTGSITGPMVAYSSSVTVNDTSTSPNVTFIGSVDNVDEGDGAFIALTAHNIDNGTTIYWSTGISGTNLTFDRLNPSGGTTTISGGNAYININVSPDNLTSPDQQYFTVYCFINAPGGSGGTSVGQWTVNINDTSQTPASGLFNGTGAFIKARNDNGTYSITPTIASFDGTISSPPAPSNVGSLFYGNPTTYTIEAGMTFTANSNTYTVTHINANKGNQDYTQIEFYPRAAVGAVADGTPLSLTNTQPFYLNTTWTIEFWSKCANPSTGHLYPVMCQYPSNSSIDVYYQDGYLQFADGLLTVAEPTPGVWTHVAIINNSNSFSVYYNGVAQTVTGSGSYILADTGYNLYLGTRGSGNFGQYFNGKLGSVRISKSIVYTTGFLPDQILQPTADTVFLWYPTRYTPTLTKDVSYNNYKVFNTGVTVDNDRPPVIHTYTVTTAPFAVFTPGFLLVFNADYPDAGTIPVGATAVINGNPATVVEVDLNQDFAGHSSTYIVTDAPGTVGNNVSVTFTWYT